MAWLDTRPLPGGAMNQLLIEPAPSNVQRVKPIARKLGVVVALAVMLGAGLWLARARLREPRQRDEQQRLRPQRRCHRGRSRRLARDERRDGWRCHHGTQDVVDQRDTWVFRFSYAGKNAGEISVPRSQLAGNGWRVVVPDQVAQNLRADGILPRVNPPRAALGAMPPLGPGWGVRRSRAIGLPGDRLSRDGARTRPRSR